MKKQPKKTREIALEALEKIEKQQTYSNLLLNDLIRKYRLTGPDVGLLTELVYGTLQRKMALDYFLQPFLKTKIETWVRHLLQLTIYQNVYLDKVPERAAIHEAVEIAKQRGHRGIAGMVNAILRSMQRKGLPSLEMIEDPIEKIAIATSHPQWLVHRWVQQYGYEKTAAMCEKNVTAPTQTARVNTTKATRKEVIEMLRGEGYQVEESPMLEEAIQAVKGNLAYSQAYRNGLLTIQDESSMIVAYALQLDKNQSVLDTCAAPGGKATHIAERLRCTGNVTALDIHEHKIKLIRQQAERLDLSNISTKILDSRNVADYFAEESFDRILVDAPCSGLGVIRRKPDIKYTKSQQDISSLQKVQLSILDAAAPLLKKGGVLVYSTCTVDKLENDAVVSHFLQQHSDFEAYDLRVPAAFIPFVAGHMMQIFPQDFNGDGFFISSLRKKV